MVNTAAIVLDGHLKSALCAVRSLGQAGVRVSVGAERSTAMARHSKYATNRFLYSSPYRYPDFFLEQIGQAATRLGNKPVIFAFSDATALLLSRHREELSKVATVVLASEASTEIVFDKVRTYDLAKKLKVPTITTFTPRDETELKRQTTDLSYPAVVKTRHSVAWKDGKGVFGTASFVHSAEMLQAKFSELLESTGEAPLVQPFIKGDEYGVECLCQAGKIHAMVIHKRLRSLSPIGGASVLKETVGENKLTKKMQSYAKQLLSELKWTGVAMVEFKVDAKDGLPKLMEINGRFWGSLPLAVFAGVDFPYLYQQLAVGTLPLVRVIGRPGIVSDHVLGSLCWLNRVWFKRDPLRELLYPSRLGALKDFALPPVGTKDDVLSLSDMVPGLFEYADAFYASVVKR